MNMELSRLGIPKKREPSRLVAFAIVTPHCTVQVLYSVPKRYYDISYMSTYADTQTQGRPTRDDHLQTLYP